ncbi:MAG: LamG domain-containing protein, partial [Anaerolineae bacterium]|nr:LamG domain-containing protein [Anaerolineae bacterium]
YIVQFLDQRFYITLYDQYTKVIFRQVTELTPEPVSPQPTPQPVPGPEPSELQIEAYDDSDIRITSGTVGVWVAGSGSKYFDDLQVLDQDLLGEDFKAYRAGEDPPHWRESGTDYYPAQDVPEWTNYVYSGRMYITDETSSIGVTFLSRYIDQYYRLRRDNEHPTFHLAPHPDGLQRVSGSTDSQVNPDPNTWYRFLIQVEDTGTRTNIRAKVWKEGDPEPSTFQIAAYDDSDKRITAGTVGIVAAGPGLKYFDDLQVRQILLAEDFEAYVENQDPTDWKDIRTPTPHQEDTSLFKTVVVQDVQDNGARWKTITDYPLLLHPLDRKALQFDGERQYLAAEAVTGLDLTEFTLEAWVKPSENLKNRANPILSADGQASFRFGINAQGKPIIEAGGDEICADSIEIETETGQFTHVALSVQETSVTFYAQTKGGSTVTEGPCQLPSPLTLSSTDLEIGRDMGTDCFAGHIKEVRIWATARTKKEIDSGRYQRPDVKDKDLVGYWPFVEFMENDGVQTVDASTNDNHLRLGGLESTRRPVLKEPSWTPTALEEFWRPDRLALEFDGQNDMIRLQDHEDINLGLHQRRTVEVWFKVDDKYVSSKKQVIYKEGTDDRGLNIYVHQGYLYFGGYNLPQDESNWRGTWLRTDRIASGRWHHAALVLDGRPEVRESSLQGFLDAKVVDVGPGSQLWPHPGNLTLGGVADGIRFHDEVLPGEAGQYFKGQMMELRVWNTARTPDEIKAGMYEPLSGQEEDLVLWWDFDQIEGTPIPDLAGHGHVAETSRPDQLESIGALPAYKLPLTPLD